MYTIPELLPSLRITKSFIRNFALGERPRGPTSFTRLIYEPHHVTGYSPVLLNKNVIQQSETLSDNVN